MKNLFNFFLVFSDKEGVKKKLCVVLVFCFFASAFAARDRDYEIANIISNISSIQTPYIVDDYVIFTANKEYRHVGIAFDHENFATIHSFQRLITYDIDNEPKDSLLFYILQIPEHSKQINYRLVIDGLWTLDPLNKDVFYNPQTNISLSSVEVTTIFPLRTVNTDEKKVSFFYEGKPGETIRLGGTFTNWDSFIYELAETKKGVYTLDLYLPPGKYFYTFYNGFQSLVDEKNPKRAYTKEGNVVSVLEVN